jgi:anti-sigma B factor antagonist
MQQSLRSPEFRCDVCEDGDLVALRLAGELDLAVARDVATVVDELIDAGVSHVVVDLRELTFVDSSGVHMLISARRAAEQHNRALSLIRGSGSVHRVLELTAAAPLLGFVAEGVDE